MNELFNQQQQQQQFQLQQLSEQQQYHANDEEYLSAQRAAVESIQIGRATLEVVAQQGEQLDRAESIADETQYHLDKAARLLRGMTWSGWLANKFTNDVKLNFDILQKNSKRREPPLVYDHDSLPLCARHVAQAMQNYHANVNVLDACETEEQKLTCQIICDTMYQTAHKELTKFQQENSGMDSYALEFALDFKELRERQLASQKRIRELNHIGPSQRDHLFQGSEKSTSNKSSWIQDPKLMTIVDKQDDHLNKIAQSLGELSHIATTLNGEIEQQRVTVDTIETKSENLLESTRMVTRRAERLTQQKSWLPGQPKYCCNVSIRHVSSGMYLSIDPNNKSSLVLVPQYRYETCEFVIFKRNSGTLFGIQCKDTKKWAGQSLLGQLACNATSYGRREDWEADCNGKSITDFSTSKVTTDVRLLIASASWGQGSYLVVFANHNNNSSNGSTTYYTLGIGGSSPEERKNASRWCITNLNWVDGNSSIE